MPRRHADLALSAIGWIGFNAVMIWMVAFLADQVVPRTVDGTGRIPAGRAVAVDLALLLLFAAQHSLLARQPVKSWLRRRVPERLERTTYVLATEACLVALLVWWQPWGGRVWHLDGPAALLLWVLCAAGWLLAAVATAAIDQLELTGLRQAGWAPPREDRPTGRLQDTGLYAVVRHPLMTGLLLASWATPQMGSAHLMFAVAITLYVLVGVRFEERDLRRAFGGDYDDYAARVPALVPRPWSPRRHRAQTR